MANKIETSSKNIKPRINLNHNIYTKPLSALYVGYLKFNKAVNKRQRQLVLFSENLNVSQALVERNTENQGKQNQLISQGSIH